MTTSRQDRLQQAESLAAEMKKINPELPEDFQSQFLRESKRLNDDNIGDFVSLVMMESLEIKKQGKQLDSSELTKLLDRVRHRVSRDIQIWQSRNRTLTDSVVAVSREDSPNSVIELKDTLRKVLSRLTVIELQVVQMLADGLNSVDISNKTGMSSSACRQLIHRLRKRLRAESDD